MSAVRTLLLVVLGIAIPAVLVAGVYLASAGPLADVPAVVAVPANKVAAPIPIASGHDEHDGRPRREERPAGKCDEKEHELEPECDPRGASRDRDRARVGLELGRSRAGPARRSDDSSGHGSGDDSSGHGSGDDD